MPLLPIECPSCSSKLAVRKLSCDKCGTIVDGSYGLPPLAVLSKADQEFIAQFVSASGSLKEMARILKVSYPTVRNRLDDIIARIKQIQEGEDHSNG